MSQSKDAVRRAGKAGIWLPHSWIVAALPAVFLASSVPAQWTNVGVGIDYQYFRVGGTNDIYVARLSRTNLGATIDTMIGQGKQPGYLETVRNQAARYDDALTWWGGEWGARNDVVVAINGGFYDTSTYIISGGQIQSGWYTHFFADAFSGFAWRMNRTPFIGECVSHAANKVYVKFQSNGNTMPIDGINRAPGASDLVIFTPQYNNQTPTGTRTEVLVEMTRPNLTTSGTGYSSGIIRARAQNTGSTWIPFDHLVLSAGGSDGTTLYNNASVGGEVRIFEELTDKNEPDLQGNGACQNLTGQNWANTFASINSNWHFLKNNVVRVPDAVAHPGYLGYVQLHPRTAICYNADYVFFVVVDGRSARSKGMACAELGYWARAALGATDGVNLDGGGSSTMVVNGVVKNVVSDGSERAVCNGVMMVNLQPKIVSSVFGAGQTVTTTGTANLRLGPGLNYGIYTSVAAGAPGTVVAHALNGVYAKGYYWWKCNFNGAVGWIAESLLLVPSTAPTITQHPANQSVVSGGTASFTVSATGTSPLSYRWQKNGVALSNGGHYSGATTNTLTIAGADANDAASYRCVVTNAYGSATSSVATLTIVIGCAPPGLANADFEGGNSGGVANGWTGYQRPPNPATVWSIQTAGPPPGGGLQYQQIANTSSTGGGGVRQVLTGCIPGATYTISGWMRGNSALATCTVKVSPTASTDWTTAVDLNPPQTYSGDTWTAFSGSVTATGSNMTLWLDGQTGGTGQNKAECFDSITIACASAPLPPGITQQPSNQTVAPGGTANFTILATGSEPLSYQWQKNNLNLADGGHYAGATTPSLSINNADNNDAASYRCVVTNAYGSTNSNPATLALATAVPCLGILNADFEGGFSLVGGGYLADHWTEWEAAPDVVVGYDETGIIHGGGHAQRIRVWGLTNSTAGGVYQRVPAAPGQPYSVSAWMAAGDTLTTCYLGVDSKGGSDPNCGVTWSAGTTNAGWTQRTVAGVAGADFITVFLKVTAADGNKRNGYFDDVAPAAAAAAPPLIARRDGDFLVLTWPECPAAHLEHAAGLGSPMVWQTATNPVTLNGGQKSVTVPLTGNAGYFRLVLE